jgi:glycosyltransferase involved in cell wall biosynthesis
MNRTKRIDIHILTKDRPTELFGLLQSLWRQTYKDFDVYVYDDASGTPINNFHFLQTMFTRLKMNGHFVEVIRNNKSRGISSARQALVDYTMKNSENGYICRLDDDTILESDYLQKLMDVINTGYDLASGVTPPFGNPGWVRSVKQVSPVINQVVLDEDGGFIINCDDCGYQYAESVILPTHHFRSCALYKKDIHKVVSYEHTLTPCGFREEEFLSFRMILAGYKLGVHTQAIAWHLQAPSGGDRRQEYAQMSQENQRQLNVLVKQWVKKHGNFIDIYNKILDIKLTQEDKFRSLNKNNNLIYSRLED